MYKKIALLLIVAVVALGVAGYFVMDANGPAENGGNALKYSLIEKQSRVEIAGSASCTATAKVPVFTDAATNVRVFAAFKEAMGGFYKDAESDEEISNAPTDVQSALDTWKSFCEKELRDEIAASGEAATMEHTIDVKGEVTSNSNDLVSVVFRTSTYTGGAHPNSYTQTVNFNPATGAAVDVVTDAMLKPFAVQLLAEKGDVLFEADRKALQAFVDTGLKAEVIRATYVKHWYVRGGKVVIVLDPYAAAPYAAGSIEITMDMKTNAASVQSTSGYKIREENVNAFSGKARGFVAQPDVPGVYPGVVMVHEWWGLKEEIKDMARELARQGYMVFAIDLYNGKIATTPAEATEYKNALVQKDAILSMSAAKQYLQEHGASKIAALGWCFGGGQAMQLAISGEKLDATVVYYGTPMITDAATLKKITWPVLGIFGDKDAAIPVETTKAFDAALADAKVEHEVYIYPGVGHAFANPSGANYAPKETVDAWKHTLRFLAENLD